MIEESQPSVEYVRANPQWLPRWEVIALTAGDTIALITFAVVGRASHNLTGEQGPFLAAINTAVPFVVAWIVVGGLVGSYRGTALYPLGRVATRTLITGVIAGPIGVILRSVAFGQDLEFPGAWTFFLMATIFSTLFVLIWRVVWSRVRLLWWTELP